MPFLVITAISRHHSTAPEWPSLAVHSCVASLTLQGGRPWKPAHGPFVWARLTPLLPQQLAVGRHIAQMEAGLDETFQARQSQKVLTINCNTCTPENFEINPQKQATKPGEELRSP